MSAAFSTSGDPDNFTAEESTPRQSDSGAGHYPHGDPIQLA